MKYKTLIYSLGLLLFSANAMLAQETRPIAFPGAEGYGKYTTGGRGGEVRIVTNLNDDGPGSLRNALNKKGPAIIIFAVSGTIHLESPLNIRGDITLAGQSAPGGGICLADYPVKLGGNNVIVRYMRFRMGDRHQNQGMVDGGGGDDALGSGGKKHIIVDHCSVSWSTDEAFTIYNGDSTTLQWNLISEPLNYSYHFEDGDKDFESHGYGGIWGGRHLSAHHNLFAHCNSRTPRFNGIRQIPEENVDYRNNVIYNWGSNNVYAGEGGIYNIVNNYYKPGPDTKKGVARQVVNPYELSGRIPYGKFYLEGNYVAGAPEVSENNWLGVRMGTKKDSSYEQARLRQPFAADVISTQTAAMAYEAVLKTVGACLPERDTLDQRVIRNVKNGSGKIIDVQGGYPHGTPYSISKNAWPALKTLPAPADGDQDGMPDAWESERGLNSSDPGDAAAFTLDKNYTNIEVYLNGLVH